MPNYRRAKVAGGTYFIHTGHASSQVSVWRPTGENTAGKLFSRMSRAVVFETRAIVLLPDHLHVIWSLPRGDAEYSRRWSWIKKEFTKQWLAICDLKPTFLLLAKRRVAVECGSRGSGNITIETEIDYERHFDYIHYNPVKHGYVKFPHAWAPSSFHRWVKGILPWHWACWQDGTNPLSFEDIHQSVGE
ncbi:MAG: transposase [Planctomycetaceae bacterium]